MKNVFKPGAWNYEENNILRITQVEQKHKHVIHIYLYFEYTQNTDLHICLCRRFYEFMRKSLWASASTNEFSNILHRHSKLMNEKKLNIGFSRWYFDEKKTNFLLIWMACKYVNSVLICHKCIRTPPYHYSDLHTGRILFLRIFPIQLKLYKQAILNNQLVWVTPRATF